MASEELHGVDETGVERARPPHPRRSQAALHGEPRRDPRSERSDRRTWIRSRGGIRQDGGVEALGREEGKRGRVVDGDASYWPEPVVVNVVMTGVVMIGLGLHGIMENSRRDGAGFRKGGAGEGEVEEGFWFDGVEAIGVERLAPEAHLRVCVRVVPPCGAGFGFRRADLEGQIRWWWVGELHWRE